MENENKTMDIPVWQRYLLDIKEAAMYYHIGENKLRALIEANRHADFFIINGNRALIKRRQFEEFLDRSTYL